MRILRNIIIIVVVRKRVAEGRDVKGCDQAKNQQAGRYVARFLAHGNRLVGAGNQPSPIPDSEIAAIQRVVESGATAIPWPYLAAGQRIRIEFGALAGLEGLVAQVRGSDRLVLSVHLLQRSVCVEIDRSWIRPLAAAAADGGKRNPSA